MGCQSMNTCLTEFPSRWTGQRAQAVRKQSGEVIVGCSMGEASSINTTTDNSALQLCRQLLLHIIHTPLPLSPVAMVMTVYAHSVFQRADRVQPSRKHTFCYKNTRAHFKPESFYDSKHNLVTI